MFSYVEIPIEQDNAFMLRRRPVSSDTQSNRQPFAGRLYVIVLDDQDVASMRTSQVKKSAKEFVDRYMGANDIAAVIHTSGRTDAAQEFTSNKQLLHAAIDKFIGPAHALAHARAARRVLPDAVDDVQRQPGNGDSSRRHRPIPAATAAWSRATSSAVSAPSACSTL